MGVVAGGHPATAEAGAWALREGGNAVDAAVAAVLASCAAESSLTGLGGGGYMLIHDEGRSTLIDFFVEAPGRARTERTSELIAAPVVFTDSVSQVFNIGAASCGVPGTAAGLELALRDFGSMPLAELVKPAISAARDGVAINAIGGYLFQILSPILVHEPECAEIYAPQGTLLREGDTFRFPELADALELFGAEGPDPFYRGAVARRVSEWVLERGGTLAPEDLAGYQAAVREPVRASFRDREIVTNPPPSSGGTLIAYALELVDRVGEVGVAELIAVMAEAQGARDDEFVRGLSQEGFASSFLDPQAIARAVRGVSSRLGATTHVTAMDDDGCCASVTCSNGTGSGLLVPGTGIHLNNMLGEEDLNPLGFHLWEPGTRLPSMMSPTVILRGGELEAGLGSAGSNRIRSAILQVILRLVDDHMNVRDAVEAPRVHFEQGVVSAEPGVESQALDLVEASGAQVDRWEERNMFFGGVQAVVRNPETHELSAAADPRRGGAVAWA